MATKIASYSPSVIRWAKQAVQRGLDLALQQGLEMERKLAALALITYTREASCRNPKFR